MRISDWSSDVCSSDLVLGSAAAILHRPPALAGAGDRPDPLVPDDVVDAELAGIGLGVVGEAVALRFARGHEVGCEAGRVAVGVGGARAVATDGLDVEHGAEDVYQLGQLERKSTRLNSSH